MLIRKPSVLILGAFFATFYSTPMLYGKDLELLARLLIPAYMALDFSVVCSTRDPAFVGEVVGIRGRMLAYAQHIKDEITESLDFGEAQAVLVEAADVAKDIALKELRARSYDGLVDQQRLDHWCQESARPFIQHIITSHDEKQKHDRFDRLIKKAKEP